MPPSVARRVLVCVLGRVTPPSMHRMSHHPCHVRTHGTMCEDKWHHVQGSMPPHTRKHITARATICALHMSRSIHRTCHRPFTTRAIICAPHSMRMPRCVPPRETKGLPRRVSPSVHRACHRSCTALARTHVIGWCATVCKDKCHCMARTRAIVRAPSMPPSVHHACHRPCTTCATTVHAPHMHHAMTRATVHAITHGTSHAKMCATSRAMMHAMARAKMLWHIACHKTQWDCACHRMCQNVCHYAC